MTIKFKYTEYSIFLPGKKSSDKFAKMKTKIIKPSFREVIGFTTICLDDVGLIFNSRRVGHMNFYDLRNADYGQGFRMPTISELVLLVHASLENRNYKIAKRVINTLKNYAVTGNTGVHYFREGVFVEDNPAMKNSRIVRPNFKTLKDKLGTYQKKGVVFSDDKSIRFTSDYYKKGSQSSLELATNTGVIALTKGEKNAKKIAKSSEHCRLDPYFSASDYPSQTKLAYLDLKNLADLGLCIGANGSEDCDNWYSFGVCLAKTPKGTSPKK